MEKTLNVLLDERWVNIRIKRKTVKRLKIIKAEKEFNLYDEIINLALDKLEKSFKL